MDKQLIIKKAIENIDGFDLEPNNYHTKNRFGKFEGNAVYSKGAIPDRVKIEFNNSKNCKVFIGSGVRGDFSINVNKNNSVIYIGNDCHLKKVILKSECVNDFIALGNHVTTSGAVAFRSGLRSGNSYSGMIIGDDCMFSHGVTVRNTDAHPVWDAETMQQINKPKSFVLIEPHVWVGQNTMVLKDVHVGACSIIGAGATVTKSAKRFSKIYGSPAKSEVDKTIFWSRSYTDEAKDMACFFYNKYISGEEF